MAKIQIYGKTYNLKSSSGEIATEEVAVKQLEAFGLTFEELYETDTETVI